MLLSTTSFVARGHFTVLMMRTKDGKDIVFDAQRAPSRQDLRRTPKKQASEMSGFCT